MAQVLSEQQEQAIRLCHHEFGGLTQREAAECMGIDRTRVCRLLRDAKKRAPQLFPILTRRQVEMRDLINEVGLEYGQIAKELDISIEAVRSAVKVLRDKGVYLEKRKPTKQYRNYMDSDIVERF